MPAHPRSRRRIQAHLGDVTGPDDGAALEGPVAALRSGREVTDREWDRMYPRKIRGESRVHFTPVAVARRAAELLVTQAGTRVLDVGAGAGKFCMVGALTSAGVFTGVELRPHLVALARELTAGARLDRCAFLIKDAIRIDWSPFDAFYLFNPFTEHLPGARRLDDTLQVAPTEHTQLLARIHDRLATLPSGTRVATFHGFGGSWSGGWSLAHAEEIEGGPLELWRRG